MKLLQPGESAGYGRRLVATEPTWIGLVPAGYADGVPRVYQQGCRRCAAYQGRRRQADELRPAFSAPTTPEQFDTIIKNDTERYGGVLRAAGIGAK